MLKIRDDDKVLLEMCQVSGSDLPTFESVACLLGNKSAEQVYLNSRDILQ